MKKPSGTTCDSATKSAWSRDKYPCTDNRQVSWLMGPRCLRTLQAAFPAIASDRAYAHCFKLPNHSDGFVQESHLFLFYPDAEDQAPVNIDAVKDDRYLLHYSIAQLIMTV